MLQELYKTTHERMHKTLEAVRRELATIRTGKASPTLLDTVKVEAYGTTMPLNQVATSSRRSAPAATLGGGGENAWSKTPGPRRLVEDAWSLIPRTRLSPSHHRPVAPSAA